MRAAGPLPPVPVSVRMGACALSLSECGGGEMCLHDCYRELSAEGMRARVAYARGPASDAPVDWCARLSRLIEMQIHPVLLRQCGVTAELIAYCGLKIERLVIPRSNVRRCDSHYYLEHLIAALDLGFDQLLLLGLSLRHFRFPVHFPPIVLYDLCGFRAEHLFAFQMSFADLNYFVLETDKRVAVLLNLKLDYWRTVLSPSGGAAE